MKTKEEIEEIINLAIKELIEKDKYLLEVNINERTITHRLAIYLEQYFENWNVDCEYNRNHEDIKKLKNYLKTTTTDDTEAKTVFPDIIVHKRGTNENNLLVIEVKKSSNNEDREKDINKLKAFKKELKYEYAVFIEIGVLDNVEWYDHDFI